MSSWAHGVANWVLAGLTALVWGSTYALFFARDAEARRQIALFTWRLRQRLLGRRGPRAVPPSLLRPRPMVPPPRVRLPPPAPVRRIATGNAVAVAEPARFVEWRADHLPMRYRLLGRTRRGANDN